MPDDAHSPSTPLVTDRVTDRVTRAFTARFQAEHAAFAAAIAGIADDDERSAYASLMLNRLMFAYFLQRTRLLDGDPTYLGAHLHDHARVRALGSAAPRSFYRDFLLPLFHHALGQPPTAHAASDLAAHPNLAPLLGHVPALNSSLCAVHPIEAANPAIQIPDAAFTRLFAFFDAYDWRLDAPPQPSARAITPDALGAIFERRLNQKQLGAYYTGEDITGYIARATILPYLLDRARERCPAAFAPDGVVWRLLRDDPDRYLYDAVRTGVDEPLPPAIAAGLSDVSRRAGWNRPASPPYALPTETWREHVARRQRCLDLRQRLARGEVHTANDLITHNLAIERLARDAIARCEGPELVRAVWHALSTVTVLDPTCGSGAFLCAALHVLEPLYAACLDRMAALVREADHLGQRHALADFRAVLARASQPPGRRAFILRSIITGSLYGVDIMPAACEVARLRLALTLLAPVEDAAHLEPLPDLTHNIQAGNALLGAATAADPPPAVTSAREGATRATNPPPGAQASELDRWRQGHTPLHWPAAFPAVMRRGGFDIILGNPPYVEYSQVRSSYALPGYQTEPCGNLYAFTCERALTLLAPGGRLGLIVPLSLMSTERMRPLQRLLTASQRTLWLSAFDVYPSRLFDGAKQRLTILLAAGRGQTSALLTTGYTRWKPQERAALFAGLHYAPSHHLPALSAIPKLGDATAARILAALRRHSPARFVARGAQPSFYVHRIPYNYVKAVDFVPHFWHAADGRKRSADYKPYYLHDPADVPVLLAALNSTLFFWWWYTLFEGYHCGRHEIAAFPIGLAHMHPSIRQQLTHLAAQLMADLKRRATRRQATYRTTGTVIYDELYPRLSKPILDQIDTALAAHYALDPEECDYIIHYSAKYRTVPDPAHSDARALERQDVIAPPM